MARRILKEIRLDRIAAVDRPCQEGAVVTILKRAADEADEAFAKRIADLGKNLLLAKAGMGMLGSLTLRKVWSNGDRKASADDRHRHHFGAAHAHFRVLQPGGESGRGPREDRRGAMKHLLAMRHHHEAASHFDLASKHYGLGDTEKGDQHFRQGANAGGKATEVEHSMRKSSPIVEDRGRRLLPPDEEMIDAAEPIEEHTQQVKNKKVRKASRGGGGRSEGRRRISARTERRGEHLGPQRPKSRFKRPRRSLRRGDKGARRHDRIRARDVQMARTGPRQLPGSERKLMLRTARLRQGQHLYGKRERRELQKDTPGRIAALIAKSSIIMSVLPDDVLSEHINKVLGGTAADYIKDFVNSANPKFAGKSKQERIRMALGAFYGKQ
jgi:hypothetical protein